MRVNRRLLSWGIFLLALGGVLVAADLRTIDTALLADLVRLWPLALLAVGFGLVLRKTRLGLPLVLAAALVPGLVLGAALAMVPRFAGDCGARGEPQPAAVAEGTFTARANVTVRGGCGSLAVSTAPGDAWRLDARNTTGRAPMVESAPNGLEVRPRGDGGDFLDRGRDAWDLTLPANQISRLSIITIAGDGRIALPGAQLDRLLVTANASRIVVDASGASVRELSGTVNVGALSISLPDDGVASGSLRIGGGALQLCLSPEASVDIAISGTAESVTVGGEEWDGSSWPRSGREPAGTRATVDVHVTFGTLEINPIGGCS
jgi:hypothetical protein